MVLVEEEVLGTYKTSMAKEHFTHRWLEAFRGN